MFEKILVATDGSSHANKALELAGNLAKVHEASLVIVHVMQHGRVPENILRMVENEHLVEQGRQAGPRLAESARSLVAVMGKSTDDMDLSQKAFQAYGEHLLARSEHDAHALGIRNVKTTLEDGDPVDCILTCAKKHGVDLIILGTRGLSDFKGMLMGSVSHKVIQLSPCTCISVK
ncbi:universal stress protein [Pseudomonadota bacterium]